MLLSELFSPRGGAEIEWEEPSEDGYAATFTVGKTSYSIDIQRAVNPPASVWMVEFATRNVPRPPSSTEPDAYKNYRKQLNGITGAGNASAVFTTVVNAIREFMQQVGHIDVLMFSAKEESRRKLYARMTKTLLPTWQVVQEGGDFFVINPQTKYSQEELSQMLTGY